MRPLKILSWVATFTGLLAAAPAYAQPAGAKTSPGAKAGQPDRRAVKLVPVWKTTTIGLPPSEDVFVDNYRAANEWVTARYAEVLKDRRAAGKPPIPPAVPAGAGDLVVYFTDRAIAARTVRMTKLFDETAKPGERAWEGFGDGGLLRWPGTRRRECGPATGQTCTVRSPGETSGSTGH